MEDYLIPYWRNHVCERLRTDSFNRSFDVLWRSLWLKGVMTLYPLGGREAKSSFAVDLLSVCVPEGCPKTEKAAKVVAAGKEVGLCFWLFFAKILQRPDSLILAQILVN